VSEIRELKLPSRLESVEEAAMQAESFVKDHGLGDDIASAIDLAVRESVANAVKHGNKFDPKKNVEVTLQHSNAGVEISVRDFGPGFAPDAIPDPTEPANLLKSSGRGIFFMKTFMDEVEWFNHAGGGVVVRMTKRQ
jgi:serine/threonine-protein kinase RsbW